MSKIYSSEILKIYDVVTRKSRQVFVTKFKICERGKSAVCLEADVSKYNYT
jgi:hypothetical protein